MSERVKTTLSGDTQRALKPPTGRGRSNGRGRGRGRPGGEESRARLLEAAGKLFARDGFHGVSTRALANAAKVNLAAIAYHFGGKQALYHDVLRQLVDDTSPLVEPIIERLDAGVKEAAGDKRALGVLAAWFIDRLFTGILGNEDVRWQMALMLREFHQPSEEFPMLLRERINPLHDAVARLVGAAKGQDPKAPETLLLTHALIGQCMVFGMARTVVWARLDWQGYTPGRVKRIIATLTPAVLAMLGLAEVEARTTAGAKAAGEDR